MDPFLALAQMAENALTSNDAETALDGLSNDVIQRWQRLFEYSHAEAVERIKEHRSDLSRRRISDEYWSHVKTQYQDQGFGREAFEYSLSTMANRPAGAHPTSNDHGSSQKTYLMKMEDPLADINHVQKIAGLSSPPTVRTGQGEDGEARFCRVDGAAKAAIEDWLARQRLAHRPTFIPESMAAKNLSSDSLNPKLGGLVDATLPQHRWNTSDQGWVPTQDQYPVWTFYYGTLGETDVLARQIGVSERDLGPLHPASVSNALLKSFGGKYKAIVDPGNEDIVTGVAYEVLNAEHEEALRTYETHQYELVRCDISLDDRRTVPGLTFRFVNVDLLS